MSRSPVCCCVLCALLVASLAALVLLAAPADAVAQEPAKPQPVSFIKDVAPILKENCFACHDARRRRGKLDLTSYAKLRKGGEKDDPIIPGNPDESLLVTLLTAPGKARMPPPDAGAPLPADKIAVIERWVAEGAKLDDGLAPTADLVRELRRRWQPPKAPAAYRYPVNINALAFTPDGKHLVVGGYHELTVWDAQQGQLVQRVRTRAERAYALQFLPDGKLAVAGGRPGQEGDVRIYDLHGGKPRVENGVTFRDGVEDPGVLLGQLLETEDAVLCLALSRDGKRLASGGCDRLVNVWDLSTGYAKPKLEQTIENHADWVFGLAFTPDGKHLLSCSRDKTAKVWDLAAKESLLTFPDHQNPVYAIAAGPKGDLAISGGEDNQLRIWRVSGDGKQVRASGGHSKAIFRLAAHPGKPLLASCSADGSVRLWDADKGGVVRTLSGHGDWVYAVAFSPDGNRLASGGWDGEVRLWNVIDGKLVRAFNASPGYHPARSQRN